MQESPVRAEATHHPRSLHAEEVWVDGGGQKQGGKGTMNVKRQGEVRMEEGQVRKRRTHSE